MLGGNRGQVIKTHSKRMNSHPEQKPLLKGLHKMPRHFGSSLWAGSFAAFPSIIKLSTNSQAKNLQEIVLILQECYEHLINR